MGRIPLRQLEALRKSYVSELPAKIRSVEEAATALERGDPGALEALFHLVHRLAGSSAIYRFPALSIAARRLEDVLARLRETPPAPVGASPAGIRGLVGALREAVERDGA
jgi:HPt (histidine-containing phosphotransfer) domain-containing protein